MYMRIAAYGDAHREASGLLTGESLDGQPVILRSACAERPFNTVSNPSNAGVAQQVEHLICTQVVGGSIPFTSSRGHSSIGKSNGLQSRALEVQVLLAPPADVAQLVESLIRNQLVPSSSLGVGSKIRNDA